MSMDNNTLRLIAAAVLTPIFVGAVRWVTQPLLDRLAAKSAARDRRRREEQAQRALHFGRKLGAWVRRHCLRR